MEPLGCRFQNPWVYIPRYNEAFVRLIGLGQSTKNWTTTDEMMNKKMIASWDRDTHTQKTCHVSGRKIWSYSPRIGDQIYIYINYKKNTLCFLISENEGLQLIKWNSQFCCNCLISDTLARKVKKPKKHVLHGATDCIRVLLVLRDVVHLTLGEILGKSMVRSDATQVPSTQVYVVWNRVYVKKYRYSSFRIT